MVSSGHRIPGPDMGKVGGPHGAHTLCLCHQNTGVQLPLDVPFFLGTLLGLLTVILGLPSLVQLQVAAANLVEQPGLLQGGFGQRDLLLPSGDTRTRVSSFRSGSALGHRRPGFLLVAEEKLFSNHQSF